MSLENEEKTPQGHVPSDSIYVKRPEQADPRARKADEWSLGCGGRCSSEMAVPFGGCRCSGTRQVTVADIVAAPPASGLYTSKSLKEHLVFGAQGRCVPSGGASMGPECGRETSVGRDDFRVVSVGKEKNSVL